MENINKLQQSMRTLKQDLSSIENEEKFLDFAIHQLTGYSYGKNGIVKLKNTYSVDFLSERDFNEIENFFN